MTIYAQQPPVEPEAVPQQEPFFASSFLLFGQPAQLQFPGGHLQVSPQLQAEVDAPAAQPLESWETLLGQLEHLH